MPKIDLANAPAYHGSGYPPPFNAPCATRTRRRLGDAGGLTDFGVNLMTLPPGGWSSQRLRPGPPAKSTRLRPAPTAISGHGCARPIRRRSRLCRR